MRFLLIMVCCLMIPSVQAKQTKTDKDFNNYVEGALIVYSQFTTPSKKESEEFYTFIKSKWTNSQCTNNCAKYGYIAGSEYVEKRNIPVKPKS